MTYIALISLTVILAIAGIILGIKAKKASAKNTELEANVAKLTAALNDEKEKAAKQAENAQTTQSRLNNMLNRQQEEHQKLSKSYDELRLAYSSAEAAKAAANKANTEAAQAKEEADRAKTEAAAAMQHKTEADNETAKAKEQLKAIMADIDAGQKKLCSLSDLYNAITSGEESLENLQTKSAALLKQADVLKRSAALADSIVSTFYSDHSCIASTANPFALLCGYDGYGNLVFVGSIPFNMERNWFYRHDRCAYQLFSDDQDWSIKQQERLKQDLKAAGVTKIICFADSTAANAINADDGTEIKFTYLEKTVYISTSTLDWINMEQNHKRLYDLIGQERRQKWLSIREELLEQRRKTEDRICELVNAGAQNFLASAMLQEGTS